MKYSTGFRTGFHVRVPINRIQPWEKYRFEKNLDQSRILAKVRSRSISEIRLKNPDPKPRLWQTDWLTSFCSGESAEPAVLVLAVFSSPPPPSSFITLIKGCVVVYHVTIVAIGHGLLKKFWPFSTRLRSTHCREFNYLKLCRTRLFR